MKLEFDVIEDAFDDTTHIRTMTEQAVVPGKGWLVRTIIYTPHHITSDAVFIPSTGASENLFEPIGE